jgi:hypothetical protein
MGLAAINGVSSRATPAHPPEAETAPLVILQLDHVVLVALDLDRVVAEHRARGFTVTPGGEHVGGLSHNALVGFNDGSYLELIAFHDLEKARGKHSWAPVAERGGGWADFALSSDDLTADAAALGPLVVRPPEDGGRARPDGVRIGWRVARLVAPLPFLIQDTTKRGLRVPHGEQAVHGNGVKGIARVVLGAVDPSSVAGRYEALRSRGAPAVEVTRAERDGLMQVEFA